VTLLSSVDWRFSRSSVLYGVDCNAVVALFDLQVWTLSLDTGNNLFEIHGAIILKFISINVLGALLCSPALFSVTPVGNGNWYLPLCSRQSAQVY
jgi:hypothetical protein